LKVLIIGCGSIGRRHIRNLFSIGISDIVACDSNPVRLHKVKEDHGIVGYLSISEALSCKPDAAIICTPTSLHVPHAIEAAKAGCHLFIEKPLSHSMEGVDELISIVNNKGMVTFVGSNFKFHPSFVKMKEIIDKGILGNVLSARCQFGQYLPDWHPWEDYRYTYSARSELGGGILLDAHEFDYMRWFLGEVEEVFCMAGKLSRLDIDTEDTVEAILRFSNGAIGEIHVDYTQRAYQRNYEFFCENGTLKWDFLEKEVKMYRAVESSWEVFKEPLHYDINDMYIEEMKHFLRCINDGERSITDIYSGYRTLMVIMAARASTREGRVKRLKRGYLYDSCYRAGKNGVKASSRKGPFRYQWKADVMACG
jgi:predicted dehydrogenase